MSQFTILEDNRERKGWSFDNYPVDVEEATLNTGDYTVAELCDYDPEKDTYYPNYAIERKSGEDFIESIKWNRDRFKREIKRASDWDSPLMVLIEEPIMIFKRGHGFVQFYNITRSEIFGTVNEWERYYNVTFNFLGTRERCQKRAFESLGTKLRASLL